MNEALDSSLTLDCPSEGHALITQILPCLRNKRKTEMKMKELKSPPKRFFECKTKKPAKINRQIKTSVGRKGGRIFSSNEFVPEEVGEKIFFIRRKANGMKLAGSHCLSRWVRCVLLSLAWLGPVSRSTPALKSTRARARPPPKTIPLRSQSKVLHLRYAHFLFSGSASVFISCLKWCSKEFSKQRNKRRFYGILLIKSGLSSSNIF